MFKNYLIQNLLLTFLLGGLAGIVYKTALHGYYTVFVPVALVLSLAINLLKDEKGGETLFSPPGIGLIFQFGRSRITSYNVCYTKLLRA